MSNVGVIVPKLSGRLIAKVGMGISKDGRVDKGFLTMLAVLMSLEENKTYLIIRSRALPPPQRRHLLG